MLGHFGFSYMGLLYLVLLFVPNLLWTRQKPEGYSPAGEKKLLLAFERAGEVLTTGCALVFTDWNLKPLSPWSLWLAVSFVRMLFYEFCWIRYFRSGHTLRDYTRPLWGIPVPLATLPVAAFFLLGVYGKTVWLPLSAAILGVGHIGIHLQHRRETVS